MVLTLYNHGINPLQPGIKGLKIGFRIKTGRIENFSKTYM